MTDTELDVQSPAQKQGEDAVPYRTEDANPQPLAELAEEAEPEKKGKKKKSWQRELLEWVLTFAVALLIVFVVRSFIFEPVYVDGDSMYPTLHNGEIMYVSKTSYGTSFFGIPFTDIGVHFTVGGEPERFDVVVCNFPNRTDRNTGARTNFVKRVVGLPGDTVEIKDGYLYVNGVRQEEKFLHERIERDWPTPSFRKKFMDGADGPYTVPEGMYLVMGDNRNNSNDSRSNDVGPISRDMIVGHVEAVLWHTIPSTLEDSGLKD
ncbi:MAG: signal peptidase I [Aristaeellaceae bacterium]